jgi:hypothetical protein
MIGIAQDSDEDIGWIERQKARFFAILASCWPVSGLLGPTIG